MLEFNNSHIITGQIKEILSTFNLPKYRIYTKENQDYHDYAIAYNTTEEGKAAPIETEKNIVPTVKRTVGGATIPINMQYAPYIKDGYIQYYIAEYTNNNYVYYWENTGIKFFNDSPIQNWTKTLKITNNIYDIYTHEYLGNYLRFKRDYDNINLMPLYNCFSNKLCNKLNYTNTTNSSTTFIFDTGNTNYKIYMLPVKLFNEYTIAIDCPTPVEICCGLYGKYQNDSEKANALPQLTYKRYNKLIFSQPVIYDLLTTIDDQVTVTAMSDLAKLEDDLKLFIKLPVNNDSSIVVLEGNYQHYNDSLLKFNDNKPKKLSRTQNYAEINFDTTAIADIVATGTTPETILYKKQQDFLDFNPITALQLLRSNTTVSYPFADRLVEYLVGNAITHEEEILDNVRRVQKVITLNGIYPDPATIIFDASHSFKKQGDKGAAILRENLLPKTEGLWDASIRVITYDKFNKTVKANNNDTNHDILGYIDKDIEKYYISYTNTTKTKWTNISSSNLYTTSDGLFSDLGEDDN